MLTKEELDKKAGEIAHNVWLQASEPELLTMVINKLENYLSRGKN